jgi:predicted transcriptional regulator
MINDFRHPEISTDIEHTELKVWNIDLADSYPDLSDDEKLVLKFILKNKDGKSLREIAPIIGISEYRVRKAVTSLEEERHIVKKDGNGRATRYELVYESVEMLTRLQMTFEELKRRI